MKTLLAVFLIALLLPCLALAETEVVYDLDELVFHGWKYEARTATTTWQGADEEAVMPLVYELGIAYPNPFNPSTTFTVSLPDAADLKVAVYNVLGQEVVTLVDQKMDVGRHTFTFNAEKLASGMYIIHASVPGELNEMQKVFLMK